MSDILSISPEIFASIRDFDWMIRSLALGEYSGKKVSKKLGTGMEFSQYRPYSQGDDLRQLDWKMYARSNKFYIKQSEVESNVNVNFIIDNTQSMLFEEQGLSKLNFAKILVGVLSFISMENGDWIGVSGDNSIKTNNNKKHWLRILNYLFHLKTTPGFKSPAIENKRTKELFVVISDLYDENNEWLEFIQSLKTKRNEVIVFHLMGETESSLDYGSTVKFKDLENNNSIQVNTANYQSVYQEKVMQWNDTLNHNFLLSGIDYNRVNFLVSVQNVINLFLDHRKRLV